jgi:hypothetical protein
VSVISKNVDKGLASDIITAYWGIMISVELDKTLLFSLKTTAALRFYYCGAASKAVDLIGLKSTVVNFPVRSGRRTEEIYATLQK